MDSTCSSRLLFGLRYNDTTNAFKAYRATTLQGLRPFLAPHFNLTVELPLKAIVRGYSWTVIPITWRNRRAGVAKLKIKEMGARYMFIVLYVLAREIFQPRRFPQGRGRRVLKPPALTAARLKPSRHAAGGATDATRR